MAFRYVTALSVVVLLRNTDAVDADSAPKLFVLTEQGQKLNHVLSTMTTSSASTCCAECSMEDYCVAISYNSRDGICNLNDRNPHDFPYFSSTLDIAWTSFGLEVKCPGPEWVPYIGTCYTAVGQWMNWNTARDHCESIEGHLVDILDEMESQFVLDVASAEAQRLGTNIVYWIGLHIIGYHTHGWISGAPLDYTRWDGTSPSYGTEHCVQAVPNGDWNDISCGAQMAVSVCEKKAN